MLFLEVFIYTGHGQIFIWKKMYNKENEILNIVVYFWENM